MIMMQFSICMLFLSAFIEAEEYCVRNPKLPDETSVPTQKTEHGQFVTPDCDSLDLEPVLDLKCLDGVYYLVDSKSEKKMPASGTPFCIDPNDPLADAGDHTHQRDVLHRFWKRIQVTLEKATVGCPAESLECFKFDRFADNYSPGRLQDLDREFIGLALDFAAKLEYNPYVDEYVREFSFAGGMHGRVIEFQNGMIFATINTEGEDDFTIYIKPCDTSEGESCKFVIYREKKIEGVVWQEDDLAEEMALSSADRGFRLDTDGIIHERLEQHGLSDNRRSLFSDGISLVAITFLYDPAIQTLASASAHSAEIILEFNDALKEHDGSGFRLLRRALVAVEEGDFNQDHGSCCGSSIEDCVSEKNIMAQCRSSANTLPPTQMAHLHHCFAHRNSFQAGTIGCGGKNNVGVTTLENGHTTNIAIHEIAHQLGAAHKSHCWCATQIIWCWKTECSIMNPSVTNTVRRFHEETIEAMNPAASNHGDTFLPFNPSAKMIPKIPDLTNPSQPRVHKILAVTIISMIVAFIVLSLIFLRHRKQQQDRRHRQELLESLLPAKEDREFTLSQPTFTALTPYQGNDNARSAQGPQTRITVVDVEDVDTDNGSDVPNHESSPPRALFTTSNTQTISTLSSLESAIEPFVETVTRHYTDPPRGIFTTQLSWDDLEQLYEERTSEPVNEADRRAWWRFGQNGKE